MKAVLVLLLITLLCVAAVQRDSCNSCKNICDRLRNSQKQKLCSSICESTVCPTFAADQNDDDDDEIEKAGEAQEESDILPLAIALLIKKLKKNKKADDVEEEEQSDFFDFLWKNLDPYTQIQMAGINIKSSGNCRDKTKSKCTSLDGVREATLSGIINLKKASGCAMTITGGTEIGHSKGTYSHSNGYKIDISLNSCITNYITSTYKYIGKRGDGSPQYKSSVGNLHAKEGDHWDITFLA